MTLLEFEVINFLPERVEKSPHHLRVDNNSSYQPYQRNALGNTPQTHNPTSTPQDIKDVLHMGRDSTVNVQVMLLDQ